MGGLGLNQQHSDFTRYRKAVYSDSGVLSRDIQRELSLFVKWAYGTKLRDTQGNHRIWDFALFATESYNGFNNKLWYKANKSKVLEQGGRVFYDKRYGAFSSIQRNLRPDYDITEFDFNNCTVIAMCNTPSNGTDFFGYMDNKRRNEFFDNAVPRFGLNILYPNFGSSFDVGDQITARVTTGESTSRASKRHGLISGRKLNATMTLDIQEFTTTDTNEGISWSRWGAITGDFRYHSPNNDSGGTPATTDYTTTPRFFSGHIFGNYINNFEFSQLRAKINNLNNIISATRRNYDDINALVYNAPAIPRFWINPTLDYLTIEGVNSVSRIDYIFGGSSTRYPSYPSVPTLREYADGRKSLRFVTGSNQLISDDTTFNNLAFFLVFNMYENVNSSTRRIALFASYIDNPATAWWVQGFMLGASTSSVSNEFLIFSPDSANGRPRTFLDNTSGNDGFGIPGVRQFNANTTYLITFYILGSNGSTPTYNFRINGYRAEINRQSFTGSEPLTDGIIRDYKYGFGAFRDDGSGGVNGEIMEVLSFREELLLLDIEQIENYLINKWNITKRG